MRETLRKLLNSFTFTMCNEQMQMRFDGPDVETHSMDVTLIGPSLFALGELCEETNLLLNGTRASVRVNLKADRTAHCVTVSLELVQTLIEAARQLVANPSLATAKEILEWIGIMKGAQVTCAASLLAFLRWKKGRKEIAATPVLPCGPNVTMGNVNVKVEGDNNNVFVVPEAVYRMSKSVKIVEAVKALTAPVAECEGIDKVTFLQPGKEPVTVDKQFARELKQSNADGDTVEPQTFKAYITVYGPIMEKDAKKWKFKLNNSTVPVDISNTSIQADEFSRGVHPGDTFYVEMEMKQRKTARGYVADYKVKQVLEFIAGERSSQQHLT